MKLPIGPRRRSDATFDVVTFGENSLDTLVVAAGPLRAAKQSVSVMADLVGGQAATAAVACARLGWRVRNVGVVGDDHAGQVVRADLERARVNVVLAARKGVSTRRAIVLVDDVAHNRSVLQRRDPALNLAPGEVPDEVFTDARILIVDAVDLSSSVAAATVAKAAGVRTIVDVDHAGAGIPELLRQIDIVILPESAVPGIAGIPELGRGLALIGREAGAVVVIATRGANGALAWCGGREFRAPGSAVDVVDTTGAGDAFRAGFAVSWLGRAASSPDLEDLLADANLVAGLNCRRLGAQASLPTPSEVPDHLRGPV